MIAQLDLDVFFHPFRVGVDAKIHLAALAHDIKCAAEFDAHLFVFRRVIDAIFANKFQAVVRRVQLADADASRRQRHAHIIFFAIFEAEINVHFFVRLDTEIAV